MGSKPNSFKGITKEKTMSGSFLLLITHGAYIIDTNASFFKIKSCRDNIITRFLWKMLDLLWYRMAPQETPRIIDPIQTRETRQGSGKIVSRLNREGTLLVKISDHFIPTLTSTKRNFKMCLISLSETKLAISKRFHLRLSLLMKLET